MMKLNQQQVQHLLLRAGFGDTHATVQKYIGLKPADILEEQLALATKVNPVKIDAEFVSYTVMKEMSSDEQQMMRKEARQDVKELNVLWLKEMANAPSGINEKMAFFWHDHFACSSQNPKFVQVYLDAIRQHALGNFGDLLRAVSKSQAILLYLNNQQNRKMAPNENFAREVMELFTLGRDEGYTEKDISEAARAFTGWGIKEGEFFERPFQHDNGVKVIMGQSGNFDGDDVLDILLKKPQTARFIAQKWVKYFVHYDGNPALEKRVADELFRTNYDIKRALVVMYSSDEFYDVKNLGSRIKSPIELITNFQRQVHVRIENDQSFIFLQRMMGQTLFDPPNVAGWPDGKDWVDSASLMFRMNLPQLIFRSALIQYPLAASFDDNDQFKLKGQLKQLQTSIDLKLLESSFPNGDLAEIQKFLLQGFPENQDKMDGSLIDKIVHITSKPEYQLC
ncbi:MAG: DUF1800 domain-containing protein [Cyclobacteriaceae bacterium]